MEVTAFHDPDHHVCHRLPVTQTNPTAVWEGATQGCENQEVGVTGGPWGAQAPPGSFLFQGRIPVFNGDVCLPFLTCRRNILPDFNKSCIFHKTKDPQCPIFRLGDIFQETGDNFSEVAIQVGGAFVP